MNDEQQQQLDVKVEQVLQELEASGEPVTSEKVRARVGRRMIDVLDAIRRVTGLAPEPDADLDPAQYPAVQQAVEVVYARRRALTQAEAAQTQAQRGLDEAEAE